MSMLRALVGTDAPRCIHVRPSPPVTFDNRTLVESPDISNPKLRLANEWVNHGCYGHALDIVDAVMLAQPGDRDARYVMTRLTWNLIDRDTAANELRLLLRDHGDFPSAKVLLSRMLFQQGTQGAAAEVLDQVEPGAPKDLWVYLGRRELEAFRMPTRGLRLKMIELMRNDAFPPNAREHAASIALRMAGATEQEYEQLLRARLDIPSNTGMACKATELASWLGDGKQRFREVIELLESPKARQGNCLGTEANRTLLAEAYLVEAAKLSATSGPTNIALIEKASRLVEGNFTTVAIHAQGRPHYAAMKPLLSGLLDPLGTDTDGVTLLCHAIGRLDVAEVRAELDAGADPEGRCRGQSLVGSLVFMATRKSEQRRAVMQVLLEHGAPVTNIDACRSRDSGDCSTTLLPLMEQYARKAQ
jgi:hypothetical protein